MFTKADILKKKMDILESGYSKKVDFSKSGFCQKVDILMQRNFRESGYFS